jgi:hypothetical protein
MAAKKKTMSGVKQILRVYIDKIHIPVKVSHILFDLITVRSKNTNLF